jgi:hypothetical protein
MTDPFEDLRRTVQSLREDRFPDLPSTLVDTILDAERTHVDARDQALRAIRLALEGAATLDSA